MVEMRLDKIIMVILVCIVCIGGFSCCLMQRAPVPGFAFNFGFPFKFVSAKEEAFSSAVCFGSVEEIEVFLKDGHDPNFMDYITAIPWHDNNPLWTVRSDYEISELFIKYGADVKNRPYIWAITGASILSNKYPNEELRKNVVTKNEDDVYNRVRLFLEAGADPNLKGCSGFVPFSLNRDKAYKKYFEKEGYLPIETPIKYSAFDVVDLLLEHGAILDESCLEAGREATTRIGNDDMEKYIQAVWEKQQDAKSGNGN
jgi:hypothetical protein